MRLLLISNSTNPGESYLGYPGEEIRKFLGGKRVKALFIPYAAVTFSYDEYERRVSERFNDLGHDIESVHHFSDPLSAVEKAEAIVVGGGNTWKLIKMILDNRLIGAVRQRVAAGIPYIGWSAGANVACPTIMTTNDMPVVEPDSFEAFNLIPFQINPHYTDINPPGHAGETREQRITEFVTANPGILVAGLREGTMLLVEGDTLRLIGNKPLRIFGSDLQPREMNPSDEISFMLKG
jgi:dipeptidase E